jgi:hypothetical protein
MGRYSSNFLDIESTLGCRNACASGKLASRARLGLHSYLATQRGNLAR